MLNKKNILVEKYLLMKIACKEFLNDISSLFNLGNTNHHFTINADKLIISDYATSIVTLQNSLYEIFSG